MEYDNNDNDLIEEVEIRETTDGYRTADKLQTHAAGNSGDASPGKPSPISARVNGGRGKASGSEAGKRAALARKRIKPDPYIWGIYIMLLLISVVELFSASSTEVSGSNIYGPLIRHGIFLVLGFGTVLWLQKTPYMLIGKLAWGIAILSLLLLLASSFMGVEINGAQRALRIAGITIQPAEIVKLSVVVLLASIFGKNQQKGGVTNTGIITAAVVVVVFSACLWKNGLTNTLLLMCVSICMMLIGGVQWKKFLIVMAAYGVAAGALVAVKYMSPSSTEFDAVSARQELLSQTEGGGVVTLSDAGGGNQDGAGRATTHKGRLKRYLEGVNPEDPIDDFNRQVVFAKFSQANGGMFGQGPGNSRESARLPLAFSDYIYSIIVEDTGFVGGALVMLLYLLLLARAGRIAYKCTRALPAFLIMGCAVMIVFQALVHAAIVTGLFPVSGQPLPFISKGGTSVLVMSAALGIMLSVARFAAPQGDRERARAEANALPDDMKAVNYSGGGR